MTGIDGPDPAAAARVRSDWLEEAAIARYDRGRLFLRSVAEAARRAEALGRLEAWLSSHPRAA